MTLPAPDRDLVLTFAEVSGVRRGRFTATADESCEPGLGELEFHGRYLSGLGIADRLPPQLTASSPVIGSTNVPVGIAITATFSEPMNPILLDGNVTLTDSGVGTVLGTLALNAARTVLTFTPKIPLHAQKFHSLTVSRNALDDAGNQLGAGSGASFYFTTGSSIDSTPPAVLSVAPQDGSTDTYANQILTVTFSEPVSPSGLTDRFAVYADGDRLTPSISVDSTGFSVNLSGNWRTFAFMTLVVSKDVTDLAGNPLGSDFVSTFTGGSPVDGTAPRVLSMRPTTGSSDIPVDKDVVLVLSEPVRPGTVSGSVFLAGPDGKLVTVAVSLSGGGSVIVIDPTSELTHDGLHTVYATPDLQDLAGNAFQNFTGTFRTVDDPAALGPRVVAGHPPSGLADVALNGVVTARFSEPVNPAMVTASTFTVTPSGLPALTGALGFEEGNTLVRFTPSANMTASRSHTLRILTGIQDVAGMPLRSQFVTSFTTGTATDGTAPSVLSLSPANGDTGIGVNAIFSVRFSEPVNTVRATGATLRVSTAGGDIVPCSIFFEEGDSVVHVIPGELLLPSTLHTITVESNVSDLAGNLLGADVTASFTTSPTTGVKAPQVDYFTPQSNEATVPLNAALKALLSEPVSPVNVSAATVTLSASGLGVVAGSVTLSTDRRLVTFTPSAPLSPNRFHTFRLTREVRDAEGNLLGDGSGASVGFTTGAASDAAPPVVTATLPENGASAARNLEVAVEFSEPVDRTSISHATVDVERGGVDVAGSFEFLPGHRIVIFRPTSLLAASSAHRLTVSQVRDLAGNVLAAPVVIDFATLATSDLVFPSVTSIAPVNGATQVPRSTAVVLQFSEPLSTVNVNASTLRLIESGIGDIAFTPSLSPDRRSLTITPSLLLSPNKFFSVYVTGLKDAAGNVMVGSFTGFTTGP